MKSDLTRQCRPVEGPAGNSADPPALYCHTSASQQEGLGREGCVMCLLCHVMGWALCKAGLQEAGQPAGSCVQILTS